MERDYYILWYRLDGTDRYAIWYSGSGEKSDGVVVDDAGRIVNFGNTAQAQAYADNRGLPLQQEVSVLHNLNVVSQWLETPRKKTVNCVEFLAAWNLFGDAAQSVQASFDANRSRTAKVYAKLLWGCNLPAMTPPGRYYEPIWTRSEVGIMQHMLGNGLAIFRRHLADQAKIVKTNS